jgi:hypothetical protein
VPDPRAEDVDAAGDPTLARAHMGHVEIGSGKALLAEASWQITLGDGISVTPGIVFARSDVSSRPDLTLALRTSISF